MNLFEFYIPEWFFVALNLVILTLILKRVLWKPVNQILEARQAIAGKTREDALETARLREEAERRKAQVDADMEARAAQLLTEARSRAGREYDRIVAEAKGQSEQILAAARAKAAQEHEKMLAEAMERISATALEATGILLRANMDNERNRKLVEVYLSEGDASA